MSLFPAYTAEKSEVTDNDQEVSKDDPSSSWLNNDSFKIIDCNIKKKESISKEKSLDERRDRALSHSRKHKRRSPSPKRQYKKEPKKKNLSKNEELESCHLFMIDRKGLPGNPNFPPPIYHRPTNYVFYTKVKKEKRKKWRYYTPKASTDNEDPLGLSGPVNDTNLKNQTEEFNIKLQMEPHNIKLWLDFLDFQDKHILSKKGLCEKKIAILDKALQENPGDKLLLNEKFYLMDSFFPSDKVKAEVKATLAKDPSNLIAWKWMIYGTQFKLSKMTAPGVLSVYANALKSQRHSTDSSEMLYLLLHCGTFLRQCGLWEQLWALIELYLELTLSKVGSGAFKVNIDLPENEIRSVEDSILTSGLTLGALWLRIEHIREGVHFLPEESADDPQRMVFTEDVSNLLYPVKRCSTSKLLAIVLVLLKVPPLPSSQCFYEFIGLEDLPWNIESSEYLLPALLKFGISQDKTEYLQILKELFFGPQYILEKLGGAEFFQAVNSLFDNCIRNCDEEQIPLMIWQMRWWRLIVTVQGKDSKGFLSKGKKYLKAMRNCIPLYVEYALLEEALGHSESALNILHVAVSLNESPLTLISNKSEICSAYRVFSEVWMRKSMVDCRPHVLPILIGLANGEPCQNITVTDSLILRSEQKFKHLTNEFVREVTSFSDAPTLQDLLVPHFITSWISCHAWFLYLTKGVWESAALLQSSINEIKDSINLEDLTRSKIILEGIFETFISLLFHFCNENHGHFQVLKEPLLEASRTFPNNVHFLHTMSLCEVSNSSWWRVSSILPKNSVLGCLFVVFVIRAKMLQQETLELISGISLQRRMYNLLLKLSKRKGSNACPLIWRLLLQFVAVSTFSENKKIFYKASEQCPWVKALYYEAGKNLPETLADIQDLLVEKELRIHIVPEELEILREGEPSVKENS